MERTVELLRRAITADTFTDADVKAILPEYNSRNGKMKRCFERQEVIRLRRGLYAFGPAYASKPIDKYSLAPVICQSSYVSFGSALFLHGLASVEPLSTQSVSSHRSATFATPVGNFTFLGRAYYTEAGVNREGGTAIATPERALVDALRASDIDCVLIVLRRLGFHTGFRANLDVFDAIASAESPSRKACMKLRKFFDMPQHDWDALHP